jgi:hypothetical protein
MANLFTLTITDPGTFPSKAAEVAYIHRCLNETIKETGRGNGAVLSGSIVSYSNAGVPNSTLGSWSYTGTATKP